MTDDLKPEVDETAGEVQVVEADPTPAEPATNRLPVLLQTANKIFRLTLLGLVLVLVALVSALTAMRIAIHGREVEVPKLVGMTPLEAEVALSDRGLRLEVENRFYGADVPEGRVLSQSPVAGTVVRRGWRVRVAESLGAPRASVPNVIGQSVRAAEINVRRRGLEVGKLAVVHLPELPANRVVAMSPPPETKGSSPKVSLLLTATEDSEAMLMPNLVGKSASDAERVIQLLGLRLAKPLATSVPPSARVTKQFPAAGSKVTATTPVRLVVPR